MVRFRAGVRGMSFIQIHTNWATREQSACHSRIRQTAGIAIYRKHREEEQVAQIRNHDNKWINENRQTSDKENL